MAFEVKNLPANAGDLRDVGSTPGLGRYPGGGHGIPLQSLFFINTLLLSSRKIEMY